MGDPNCELLVILIYKFICKVDPTSSTFGDNMIYYTFPSPCPIQGVVSSVKYGIKITLSFQYPLQMPSCVASIFSSFIKIKMNGIPSDSLAMVLLTLKKIWHLKNHLHICCNSAGIKKQGTRILPKQLCAGECH